LRNSLKVSHGEMTNATTRENSIAADALTGIGRMYGPISPDTKASGIRAAMTVKVARIVGLPTSSTAYTVASLGFAHLSS
jgi:hypothetical protein